MRDELQNKLYEKYPLIFADKDKPMTESCMYWGIETGDGWYDLIDNLCGQLQWHTDKNGYPQIVAEQVKEKFGTLRFYYRHEKKEGNKDVEYLRGMIDFAEGMSSHICEVCGEKGKTNGKGWIATRCEKCV